MQVMGCPYSDPGLAAIEGGGTPYIYSFGCQRTCQHEREMAVRWTNAKWSRYD